MKTHRVDRDDEISYPEPLRYVPIEGPEREKYLRIRQWTEYIDDDHRNETQQTAGGYRGGSRGGDPFHEFSKPGRWGYGIEYGSFRYVNTRLVLPPQISGKWGINVYRPFFDDLVADITKARVASPTEVAQNFLKNLFTPFFLIDRALLVLEHAGSVANVSGYTHNAIWHGFEPLLSTIWAWAGNASRLERAYCVWFAGASASSTAELRYIKTKTASLLISPDDVDWPTNHIHGLTPGRAASQILSDAISGKTTSCVVGLNFLFGAKIPSMLGPDLFFAFEDASSPDRTRKILLPFNVVDAL